MKPGLLEFHTSTISPGRRFSPHFIFQSTTDQSAHPTLSGLNSIRSHNPEVNQLIYSRLTTAVLHQQFLEA